MTLRAQFFKKSLLTWNVMAMLTTGLRLYEMHSRTWGRNFLKGYIMFISQKKNGGGSQFFGLCFWGGPLFSGLQKGEGQNFLGSRVCKFACPPPPLVNDRSLKTIKTIDCRAE